MLKGWLVGSGRGEAGAAIVPKPRSMKDLAQRLIPVGVPLSQEDSAGSVEGMTASAPDPQLSDGVVILRSPDERDLAAIDLGIHDPDVVHWFGQPDASATDVTAMNRKRAEAGSPTLSICETDGACLGLVWVNANTTDPTIGTVGYWLLPAARGRGLAARAVRLLSAWAIRDLGFRRLRLLAESSNERSQRVAERSGFRRAEVLVGNGTIDGRSVDQVPYELATSAG